MDEPQPLFCLPVMRMMVEDMVNGTIFEATIHKIGGRVSTRGPS